MRQRQDGETRPGQAEEGEDTRRDRRGRPGQDGEERPSAEDRQRPEREGQTSQRPAREQQEERFRRWRERDNPEFNRDREQRAREIIEDNRRSEDLDERALRRRLDENRDALQRRDMNERERARLLERLERDREALRQRVDRDDWEFDPDRFERRRDRSEIVELRRRYLDNPRRRDELDERDLRRRAYDIEWMIEHGDLSPAERRRLSELLEEDRGYLRRELREERERRWRERDRWRYRDRNAEIYIEPGVVFVPQPYISAAEYPEEVIYGQLSAPPLAPVQQRYDYQQIVQEDDVRELMPAIDLDNINFGFGEAFIRPEEVEKLDAIGIAMEQMVAQNPEEVYLIEGHTDAVGSDEANLELSRQRAEAVKEALLEYYNLKPENLQTVGYGERYLKIPTDGPEQENRRVSVRRITPLIAGQ
ncbi:OmpA family protein [Rhodoligotrophos ferricapiens]|uniref:OmpA family protein n=1 Tax=Rhodoligotrophos ferricapiens TaxID=3069264 RepID=UPI00315C776B